MTLVPSRLQPLNGSKSLFMRLFFLILMTALPIFLWAQRSGNPQKTFLSGKDFYNSGQYHMAAETFKGLTTYTNNYTEYATFYYGLSSYYNGQEEIAKNILLQLSRKYPGWNKSYGGTLLVR